MDARAVDFGTHAPQLVGSLDAGASSGGLSVGDCRLNLFRILALCLVAAALPGCALLGGGGSAPVDTFELGAASPEPAGPRRSRVQVLIAEPSALKSLDSENIVIKPSSAEVQYLKGAQWADRLPKVVQSKLAQAFQSSGRFGGVGKPGEGLAIDFQVVTEIRSFEVRLDGQDRAEVELFVRILNDRNGTVRAAQAFTASSPLTGTANADYTAALDRAFRQVSADIVDWSVRRM